MGSLLYWPLATVLMAAGQGFLLPAIRRTVPGPEARRQSFALHYLLVAAFFLPLLLTPSLLGVGLGVGCRLLLFDPVLNWADEVPIFYVGQTALTDRALRWLAARLSWPPERLRLVVWVLSLLLATFCLLHFRWLATFCVAKHLTR